MKIAYITDTHLGVRQGSSIFRQYFREYYLNTFFPLMKEKEIDLIVHGGDFFDNRNHVTSDDIDYIKKEFLSLVDEYEIKWEVIAGNHDVAYRNTNLVCSLNLLDSKYINNNIMEPKLIDVGNGITLCLVPWINSENYESTINFLNSIKNKQNCIVVGHYEIQQFRMYSKGAVCEHGLSPEIFKEFKQVLSGHFHHSSKYNNIEYLGSAFCLTWQDYNDWRGIRIYDTETDLTELIETEKSLFVEIKYPSKDIDISNKFVKVVIDSEYKAIELKDYISWCQEQKPIKISIEDKFALNSIINEETDDSDDTIVSGDVLSYFKRELDIETYAVAETVFALANEQLAKGE